MRTIVCSSWLNSTFCLGSLQLNEGQHHLLSSADSHTYVYRKKRGDMLVEKILKNSTVNDSLNLIWALNKIFCDF